MRKQQQGPGENREPERETATETQDSGEQQSGGGRKKPDIKRLVLIGVPMLLAAIALSMLDPESKLLWFEDNTPTKTSARFYRFSGEKVRQVKVDSGELLQVRWEAEVKRGELYTEVRTGGQRLSVLRGEEDRWEIRPEEGRSYRLVVTGKEARGSFTISWSLSSGQ